MNREWIWQDNRYPNFEYDLSILNPLIEKISFRLGELKILSQIINNNSLERNWIENLEDEIISNSAIEGEILERQSVRSSIKNRLLNNSTGYKKEKEDGYVEVLLDAINNTKEPLSIDRLLRWHYKIFEYHNSKLFKINIGSFRTEGTMQIVSGIVGKEKVFYEAPDSKILDMEIKQYIDWFNNTPSSLIKASIAHLWFVIIHPFDDGNGRIARFLTEMVLSDLDESRLRLYSMSNTIYKNRSGYYKALEKTTGYKSKDNLIDITNWCEWFLKRLLISIEDAISKIENVTQKAKFWEQYRDIDLNNRQIKILNILLDDGRGSVITTKKYAKIAKTSPATAFRDIKELLEYQIIRQVSGSRGRNIRYEIIF